MSTGATFETLLHVDTVLASHRVHPMSAWWRDVLSRWYAGDALTLAVCAGRGSAKTTVMVKVALNELLYGAWDVAPGERHWASLTSRLKDEATKTSMVASEYLRLLGIRHTSTSDGVIELADMPRGIRVTACNVGATSGWRSGFDGNDETGKWAFDNAPSFDAAEVLASKRAMTATHPNARHMVVSSPFLDSGPFYEMISAGSNDHTMVATAPTWIATDGRLSEAMTRKLEPNAAIHAREYGAQFGVEWEDGFFAGLIEPCISDFVARPFLEGYTYNCSLDPAFSSDIFAGCIAHAENDRVIVDRIIAIEPPRDGSGLSPTDCLRRVRQIMASYRCTKAYADQHHAASLIELAEREGVRLESVPWTAANKGEKFEIVRNLMRDRRIVLPDDPGLRRELGAIATRNLASGHQRIEARYGTDDRVSALVLAVSNVVKSTPGARMLTALASPNGERHLAAVAKLATERSPITAQSHIVIGGVRYALPRYR